jgi:hypothetical protein
MNYLFNKKLVFTLVLPVLFISSLLAQPIVFQDPMSGKTFNPEKYSDIKGSPFLFEKWMPGSVTTEKAIYKNLDLKLDSYSNTLFFKKDDQPYELEETIKSFTLAPAGDTSRQMFYKKGFSQAGLKPDQYVQVLAEGKLGFYRSDIKLLAEMSEINRGIVKSFTTSSRYFIAKNGSMQLVKLSKKEFLSLLADQDEKIQAYIKDNKLSINKEDDARALVKYYNSL